YELDMNAYQQLLKKKPKLICVTGMSNVTGTIPNIKKIIQEAHKINARVLIDGAQSVAHQATDVQKLGCDFLTFSAHKMLGPTGVGILYGKKELLEKMPPFLYGGDMVKSVEYKNIVLNGIPWKFEAGTPNIADVIAFGKALEYLTKTGLKNIETHDKKLLRYAKVKFSKYPKVKIYSPENTENSGPVFSFTIEGIHPHDIASVFNEENIAIRSGHHCCQPLMESLNISGTARMSFYFYNTEDDIDRAEKALKHVLKIFK
ncbi:aminotransferase class V-fold PLP-dependent enzyme, partial [Candidatus Peregrinibacteria bacterium]|nr:aminotransferase class V-fold PLP-dependent enzyme [Candidatus Peregrinibacteria bacterium]